MAPKKIPIGIDNFADMVDPTNNALFVDKTLFIKEVIEDISRVILITRPRRWGKTLNMSMLKHFLAAEVIGKPTKGLFDGLAISTVDHGKFFKEHQGQYPVIYISFKDVKEDSFSDAIDNVRGLMQMLFQDYDFLLPSEKISIVEKDLLTIYASGKASQADLQKSLLFLSKLLCKFYGKPVYILIDEYDTPLNAAYGLYLDKMTKFMRNLFSKALKDNEFVKKCVMTGIMRISKDSMLSGLNHLSAYTLLKKEYREYFGFTDKELDGMFKIQRLVKDEAKVKAWYNGYQIGGLTLYNPWSILNCLKEEGELRPYWVNTADDSLIKIALYNASLSVQEQFQQLLEGRAIQTTITESVRYDAIHHSDGQGLFSVLLFMGYLKVIAARPVKEKYLCDLMVPNQEVAALYEGIFANWLTEDNASYVKALSLLDQLLKGNIAQFTKDIEDFLMAAASIHDYAKQPEAFYHGFMLALTAIHIDEYYIHSNQESGHGRPDLLFIPKNKKNTQAIILEFKRVPRKRKISQTAALKTKITKKKVTAKARLAKEAEKALKQINAQYYAATLTQYKYVKCVVKVGFAFDGKTAGSAYEAQSIIPQRKR